MPSDLIEESNVDIIERSYVVVSIGRELYGIDIRKVKEVIRITDISHIPNALPFMKGIVNLRGRIIPIIDTRIKFGIAEKEYDFLTAIVIVKVRKQLIGMVVDSVQDVVDLQLSKIQDIPHFSANIETDFINGVAHVNDRIMIAMNVEKILSNDEFESVTEHNRKENE